MAGGMKIDDHKFFAGKGSPDFPKGVHVKHYTSASDAGAENDYEDTTEAIKRQQDMGASKAKGHATKSGYRN